MKRLIAAVYFIPAFALAHPGHSEGFHSFFHPEVLLLIGLALTALLFFVRRAGTRKPARIR